MENEHLRAEVCFLRGNPSIARGIKGETLIAGLLRAQRASPGSGHDLVAQEDVLIEVKYSALLNAMANRTVRRWVWTKLFGELGKKQFHRLLLLGDADARFKSHYADPESPYVIFDLTYSEAATIVGGVKPGRLSRLHLTTNPSTVKSWRAKELFERYQVTTAELQARYPKLGVYEGRET
jgi:hypothetical protein